MSVKNITTLVVSTGCFDRHVEVENLDTIRYVYALILSGGFKWNIWLEWYYSNNRE